MSYVAGKITVICNDSGSLLNLFLGKDQQGNGVHVTLHPRKGAANFDIEEILDDDPKMIKRGLYHLRALLETGRLSWHPKGSDPKSKFPVPKFTVPKQEGVVVNAPSNEYDKALNNLIEKDEKQDEKTKAGGRRDLRREVEATPSPPVEPSGLDLPKREAKPEESGKYDDLGPGAIAEIAMEKGIIDKVGGGYYKFGDRTLGRGGDAIAEALEKDKSLMARVKAALPS